MFTILISVEVCFIIGLFLIEGDTDLVAVPIGTAVIGLLLGLMVTFGLSNETVESEVRVQFITNNTPSGIEYLVKTEKGYELIQITEHKDVDTKKPYITYYSKEEISTKWSLGHGVIKDYFIYYY